ncbi:hypothetical protein ZWY2020_050951 [Hordeum vulgare]|nr:hypothetical protein ZWY2020_050951 [Hordeum vulgare]
MGMNLSNMAKMLCCASNDGIITIKADDCSDTVTFMFESPNQDKSDDFKMKLMDIDIKHLDIPDSEYQAIVCIPSFEFSRICKDLSSIGDTDKLMSIIYSNFYSNALEGLKFSTARDIGTANIVCKQNKTVDKTEFPNGPNHEPGGVNIQRRRECGFPTVLLPSHPKGWTESWFYYRDTSPPRENPIPGFRTDSLPMDFKFPDKLTQEEESEFIPIFSDLKFLKNNGLIGIDLFHCWIEWNILPLSHRDGLMYDYDGTIDHPQHVSRRQLSESEIVGVVKKLTGESLEECAKIGLKAFCHTNPLSPVRIQPA